MNIRDYLFIRKAKSSNKIKILDVLGFEADTTIIQTPDIIKEMDNLRITNEFELVDEEIESVQIGQELVTTKENIFDTREIEESNPDTQTFIPLNITSQIKKIWTDLEMRRQWVVPTLLVVATVSIISFVSVFFINMRNNNIQNETIAVSITENTINNISGNTGIIAYNFGAFSTDSSSICLSENGISSCISELEASFLSKCLCRIESFISS